MEYVTAASLIIAATALGYAFKFCRKPKKKEEEEVVVDPALLLAGLLKYIRSYRAASKYLPESGDILFPRMQVRGQLLELALKAFIAACGDVIRGHNLEKLARQATGRGLILTQEDWDERVHQLNSIYFTHKESDEKFLSRYPDSKGRGGVWVTPGHEKLDEMIQRIIDQAEARLKSP